MHDRRRCTDEICYSTELARKKRARNKYEDRKKGNLSSDSEQELLRNREELKMALNIIEPSNKPKNSSTLSHKLSAIQSSEDGKKSMGKYRKRRTSTSPDTQTYWKRARSSEKRKTASVNSSTNKLAAPNKQKNLQENEDEAISLEEQELRLIALKSAVLKKHEARKKKLVATQIVDTVIRPYSPTDSVVLAPDDAAERQNDCIDSDNNNMDISPISSPGNQYQPMDMDLVSSNENSRSPIFSYEKPQTFAQFDPFIDWATVAIPVPINAAYVDIDQANMNPSFAMQPSFTLMYDAVPNEPSTVDISVQTFAPNDNEDELRATLIQQMRSTNSAAESKADHADQVVVNETMINVDSLEEDCLRSLLLSSKAKKTTVPKEVKSDSSPKLSELSCDDMPKLASNLREALKRLKNRPKNKNTSESCQETNTDKDAESICDGEEIQQTVLNNHVETNEQDIAAAIDPEHIRPSSPAQIDNKVDQAPKAIVEKPQNCAVEPAKELAKNQLQKEVESKQTIVEQLKRTEATKPKPPLALTPKVGQKHIVPSKQVAKLVATTKIVAQNVPKSKVDVPLQKPQSQTPPIPTRTVTTTTIVSANSLELSRMSTSSPIITTWTPKPVKKLIISLNEDSTTDDDLDDDKKRASIRKTDADSGSQSNDASSAFQMRLDQFLQTVRNREIATQEKSNKPQVASQAAARATEKFSVSPKKLQVRQLNNLLKDIEITLPKP